MTERSPKKLDAIVAHITSSPCVVILIDTCIILDIYRAIVRSQADLLNLVLKFLVGTASNPPDCHFVITDLVLKEYEDNRESVLLELRRHLDSLEAASISLRSACEYLQIDHANLISFHKERIIEAHVEVVERMLRSSILIESNDTCKQRAHDRVTKNIQPSRKGGGLKDCSIFEHFVELSRKLRQAGFNDKIVFVSSNTRDYDGENKSLHPNLQQEFSEMGIAYAHNFGEVYGQLLSN